MLYILWRVKLEIICFIFYLEKCVKFGGKCGAKMFSKCSLDALIPNSNLCSYSDCYKCMLDNLKNQECHQAYYRFCMKQDFSDIGHVLKVIGLDGTVAKVLSMFAPTGSAKLKCDGKFECGGKTGKTCNPDMFRKFSCIQMISAQNV